jgi:replicative DNA helicase
MCPATVEESVVKMIGESFTDAAALTKTEAEVETVGFFSMDEGFDADFQTKIAAFACRDDEFMRRVAHLLKPDYFENAGEAALVNIALRHFAKYRCVPDNVSMAAAIREDVAAKIIRKDVLPLVVAQRKVILHDALRNREYVEDKVVEFVRHQAVGAALLKSVDLRDRRQFDKITALMKTAIDIGLNEEGDGYDYAARIGDRTTERLDKVSGKRPPQGITTGIVKMDEMLYHRGWGRKELAAIMGAAKAGKTASLINFAQAASLAGYNVLYVTLEVGAGIIADRMDASISSTMMKELSDKIHGVREKVEEAMAKAGRLIIHEYASGTMSPNMLRKLIERYKSPGRNVDGSVRPITKFDLIVVDYADIMAPNYRTQDTIENSKSVYVDLRAIAFEENVAMLTATQANREGHKAAVVKAEHVAEDFNKVRTVDLMISINKTEEEARDGIARLYFAASRNQESGFTIVIKQNLACMQFVTSVLRIE